MYNINIFLYKHIKKMAQINWIERYPDSHSREMVQDAYETAVKLELLDAIKNLNPQNGFMFTNSQIIDKISANLKYTGHSGCSFGWTMRQVEYLANNM
jgi:hypothetical protein